MKHLALCLFMFLVAAVAYGQEVSAPTCIRISSATPTDATIQFEPHGGDIFEAERYYGGRWIPYRAAIVTSGQQHSLTVPLSSGMINIVRGCAVSGSVRQCASEGVYAKR